MANETQVFLKELALSGHPLLERIIAFNTRLAQNLPLPEAGESMPHSVLPARTPFAAQRLGRALPALLGEEFASWVLDFRQPSRRIVLLPTDRLVRLIRWYGLAAFQEEIVRCIDKETVVALEQLVGPEGRRFALQRAVLLTGNRVPVPGALQRGRSGLPERILGAGRAAVLACVAGAGDVGGAAAPSRLLHARLRRMLPQEFSYAPPEAVPPSVTEVWPIVRKLVIKEISPTWAPCFT